MNGQVFSYIFFDSSFSTATSFSTFWVWFTYDLLEVWPVFVNELQTHALNSDYLVRLDDGALVDSAEGALA